MEKEIKELTCIGCPLGCMLSISLLNGIPMEVTGNTCKNGESYAIKEITNPERIVTSTVRVLDGDEVMVPVKTDSTLPRKYIFECMKEIHHCKVHAPVQIGDILIANVAGTQANIIATGNIKRRTGTFLPAKIEKIPVPGIS